MAAGLGDRVAYYFEGDRGDTRAITYRELTDMVCQAADTLDDLGVKEGDRVAIYMPMIPETVVAMLACARIGAPHTVVFGGFSSEALRHAHRRLQRARRHHGRRRLPSRCSGAAEARRRHGTREPPSGHTVLVVGKATGGDIAWTMAATVVARHGGEGDAQSHEAKPFDAEHPLYVMYTSGTTGKPEGHPAHLGGYLTGCSSRSGSVFDLKAETDVYWTAADIGWVTGHSYIVYGPLSNATTSVLYEGTPDSPHQGRWWEIIDKYKVTQLYCAPTAIRTFMKWGAQIAANTTCRVCASLGRWASPSTPRPTCGTGTTSGTTRTRGRHLVADGDRIDHGQSVARCDLRQAGCRDAPLPGISGDVVNERGQSVPNGEGGGYLVLTEPWPSMLRTIWGDDERYVNTYWSSFPGQVFRR